MPGELIVTATNGVRWKRDAGATSAPEQLFAAMQLLAADWHERQWNWWRDGQIEAEEGKARCVWHEWDHAEPPPGGYQYGGSMEEAVAAMEAEWDAQRAERERARLARQERFDEERSSARITMLQNQADAGFMRRVLAHPATAAQRAKAEEKLAKHEHEAARLAARVGDPDEVADRHGDLPPGRRTWHLSGLMTFRHRLLRELDEGRQRQRFRTILAMPGPDAAEMCSECEALAVWHTWDVSSCLYRGKPEPGSQAATIARLLPGCWERCHASMTYRLDHAWGLDPLPDFDGAQWIAMLSPLLRAGSALTESPGQTRGPSRTAVLCWNGSYGGPRRRPRSCAARSLACQHSRSTTIKPGDLAERGRQRMSSGSKPRPATDRDVLAGLARVTRLAQHRGLRQSRPVPRAGGNKQTDA